MAIWRSQLAQTAVTVAAAREASSEDVDFNTVRDEVFAYLEEKAKEDDAAFDKQSSDKAESKSSTRSSTGGGGKAKGKGRRSSGGSSVTLEDALKMDLSFGAFEGVTLAELLDIDAAEADRDYEYGDGERNGRDYLSWLASERNPNEFARKRALLVAEENGIEVLS